ncbi:MAG: acyltransferase family protein [Lachnospiraceae bacterium]|nr:acyltransferase family protein [Lachnospiraceae bacterium]
MKADNKQYNVALDVYRILFTTLILLHHFRSYSEVMPYGGGYMATDFFFMLSGYLMFGSFKRYDIEKASSKLKASIQYLIKRYKRLLIPLISCNICLFVLSYITIEYRLPCGIFGFIKENLMIEVLTCDIAERFNPSMWYLGTLLLATIICFILIWLSKFDSKIIGLARVLELVIVISYLYLIYSNGNGNIYPQYATIFDWRSILRGISGMATGIVIASVAVGRKRENIANLVVLSVLGIAFLYLLGWKNGYSRFDILIYILIAIGIIAGKNSISLKQGAFVKILQVIGKASYFAFIIHYPIIRIINYYRYFDGLDWKIYSILFLLCIWILAILCQEIALALNKLKRRTSNV